MLLRLLAAAASIGLALASGAGAETRAYVELDGGASFAQHARVDLRSGGSGRLRYEQSDQLHDLGLHGGGSVGVHVNADGKHSMRVELDGSYRRVYVDELRIAGTDIGGTGDASAAAGVLNLFYEHDFGNRAWVDAFVGIGAGAAVLSIDARSSFDPAGILVLDDDDARFAWNAMTGVLLPLTDHVGLSASYRFFRMLDARMDTVVVDPGTGQLLAREEVDVGTNVHEVVLGVRVTF